MVSLTLLALERVAPDAASGTRNFTCVGGKVVVDGTLAQLTGDLSGMSVACLVAVWLSLHS